MVLDRALWIRRVATMNAFDGVTVRWGGVNGEHNVNSIIRWGLMVQNCGVIGGTGGQKGCSWMEGDGIHVHMRSCRRSQLPKRALWGDM
jgi:hypothetical protein